MEHSFSKSYLSLVKRALICSRASRKQLLTTGRALIQQFEEENPQAQYADLMSAFGTPECFAMEMLSTLDEQDVKTSQRKRKHILQLLLCGLILLLLAISIVASIKWINAQNVIRGDFYVVTSGPQEITEEEFLNAVGS